MTLGSTVLGTSALGSISAAPDVVINYVDCAAQIICTSSITAALAITSTVPGEVHLMASIAMQFAITAAINAVAAYPANAGVSFTLSDKAGGV